MISGKVIFSCEIPVEVARGVNSLLVVQHFAELFRLNQTVIIKTESGKSFCRRIVKKHAVDNTGNVMICLGSPSQWVAESECLGAWQS